MIPSSMRTLNRYMASLAFGMGRVKYQLRRSVFCFMCLLLRGTRQAGNTPKVGSPPEWGVAFSENGASPAGC